MVFRKPKKVSNLLADVCLFFGVQNYVKSPKAENLGLKFSYFQGFFQRSSNK
jgi:hypothetical protein